MFEINIRTLYDDLCKLHDYLGIELKTTPEKTEFVKKVKK
jgi:hypothetical protein